MEGALTKKEAKEHLFKDAADHGFDLRHAVGALFTRALKDDPALNGKYKALKGLPKSQKLQDNFRKGWAEGHYTQCCKEKQHLQSWKKVDVLKGYYRVFEKMVMEFGHHKSKPALQCAVKYAAKCKLMGKPWVQWDSMPEVNSYLFIRREFTQEFTQCWSEWCSFSGHPDRLLNNL